MVAVLTIRNEGQAPHMSIRKPGTALILSQKPLAKILRIDPTFLI
jgi:hypothetical protein